MDSPPTPASPPPPASTPLKPPPSFPAPIPYNIASPASPEGKEGE